jgi:HK97 family phage prohead protease
MTLLQPDMFLKPVKGHEDLFAFNYGFTVEGKSLEDTVVTETEEGDLLIEGWAADFTGMDREGENFAPGAFQRGIKSFLDGQAALCFHHQADKGIGTVLDLKEEGKGLYMKARVDHQPESSPLRYIYNAVKKGSYKGLSVGGFFKRAMGKIADVDFTEISVTPVAVHPGTSFAVVAGKALETDVSETTVPEADFDAALDSLRSTLDSIEALGTKALPKSHDPQAASLISGFLGSVGRARTFASGTREISDNDELVALGDEVESQCVKWEATAHKLAAKVGPLPPADLL